MSKSDDPTVKDVFYLVLFCFIFLFLGSMSDSCQSGIRYRDLRDRLERLERR